MSKSGFLKPRSRGSPMEIHKPKIRCKLSCPNCKYDFAVQNPAFTLSNGPHSFAEVVGDNSRSYTDFQNKKPYGSRLPLVLKCGHSVCERCVRRDLETHKVVTCGQCLQDFNIENGPETNLYNSCPVNYYYVGLLTVESPSLLHDNQIQLQPAGIDVSKRPMVSTRNVVQPKKSPNKRQCMECSLMDVVVGCFDCKLTLCRACFILIHTPKCFQHHIPQKLGENNVEVLSTLSLRLSNCKIHTDRDQPLQFHCKTCNVFGCQSCAIINHMGHTIIDVGEYNRGRVEELQNAKEKIVAVKNTMEKTLKIIEQKLSYLPVAKSVSPIELELTRYFHELHGLLQITEKRLRNQLEQCQSNGTRTLTSLQKTLQDQLQQAEVLLHSVSRAENPKCLPTIDIDQLIQSLSEFVDDAKCHLLGDQASGCPKLNIDEAFATLIDKHCTLEVTGDDSFTLVSTQDLPENYEPKSILSPSSSEVSLAESATRSSPSLTKITSENSPWSGRLSNPTRSKQDQPRRALVAGACVPVCVSHIKNPSHFYVQHSVDANDLVDLSRQYTMLSKRAKRPTDILQNGLYLVDFDDRKWYRGQIKTITTKENGDQLYDIFYIDFGNVKTVTADKLRLIPAEFMNDPPKAHRCCLFDLVPRGEDWTEEANRLFLRMIDRSNINMCVMTVMGDLYSVDLLTTPKDYLDMNTSVRDALIFLEEGSFVTSITYPTKFKTCDVENKPIHYRQFEKMEILDITCSFIESPYKIYVHLTKFSKNLNRLRTTMMEKYTKLGMKGMIYTPVVGMACAVRINQIWYRAYVTELPGNSVVNVFLIDYGYVEAVSWIHVRKLYDEFKHVDAQAILCSLMDVKPLASDTWTQPEINFLKKMMEGKALRMQVNENESPLMVTIYDCQFNADININATLVIENFAKSTGISSRCSKFHRLNWDLMPQIIPTDEQHKQMAQYMPHKAKSVSSRISHTKTPPIIIQRPGEPPRVQVHVLSIMSPGCIYVRLVNRNKDLLDLQEALDDFYNNQLSESVEEWKVGDKCAACINGGWYRAIIGSFNVESQKLVQIFIKDHARYETVDRANLRKLDERFATVRDGSVKCHMYGIKAAGDKDDVWPMLACERLRELVSEYPDIYITKRGDVTKDRSLPVDIWVLHTTPGGALEPSKSEWILLNSTLADAGVVIPTKRTVTSDTDESREDFTDLETTGTVADWLELSENKDVSNMSGGSYNSSYPTESWLPVVPFKKRSFQAICTHVDEDMNIYIHDVEVEGSMRAISSTLNFRFKDSKAQSDDMFWRRSQLCTVKNPDDGLFYRGEVLDMCNDGVIVRFVDYGYLKICRAANLRKQICMEDIAIRATKCRLHNIHSKDMVWAKEAVEFVCEDILNKEIHVEIVEFSDKLTSVRVRREDVNLAETLLAMNWAITDMSELNNPSGGESDCSVVIEDIDSVSMSGMRGNEARRSQYEDHITSYKCIELPESLHRMQVEVASVGRDYLTWYVQPLNPEALVVAKRGKYKAIINAMQEESKDQAVIHEPTVGMACTALYKHDNQWYRGEILAPIHLNSDSLIIMFTDYGNMETVPRNEVREMKPDWLTAPMQCLKCNIAGIQKSPDIDDDAAQDALSLVLFKGLSTADIILRKPLTVQFFDHETTTLKYQKLIDNGVLIKLT